MSVCGCMHTIPVRKPVSVPFLIMRGRSNSSIVPLFRKIALRMADRSRSVVIFVMDVLGSSSQALRTETQYLEGSFGPSGSGNKVETKVEPWFRFCFQLYEFSAEVATKRKQKRQQGSSSFACIFLEEKDLSGIPLKSILNAYEDEILKLRRKRPPVSYRRIAEMLQSKYNVCIQHAAIVKYVKRAPRRKARRVELPVPKGKSGLNNPVPWIPLSKPDGRPKQKFEFTYSEQYNLTRLSPEEAEALRKKLEAEGH